ncbi:MAG: recombinase family protein [Actinomycetaceae bacterium]|nr:recombinase family protein [Actinomycetaceae bacterium]
MTVYGYARVSTKGQSLAPQRVALRQAGVEHLVEEKLSGVADSRPQLARLLDTLAPGDTLVVYRLDRLGRSLPHLVSTVEDLANRGVSFRSLHENVDTSSANGRLMLGFFALLAQFERDLISERTKAGMVAAAAQGRAPGRPRALVGEKLDVARSLRDRGYSYAAIARSLGVAKSTVATALNP